MDMSLLTCEGEHSDMLAIDDLLDFSNDHIGGPIDSSEIGTSSDDLPTLSFHISSPKDNKKLSHHAACIFDSNELSVPCDDLAQLEWLSNFVEESFSSGEHIPASFCFGAMGNSPSEDSMARRGSPKDSYQSTSPLSVLQSRTHLRERPAINVNVGLDAPLLARTRSKRCRTAVCFWNSRILSAEASESLLECSPTGSTITSDSDMITTYYYNDDDDDDDYHDKDDNEDEDEDKDVGDNIDDGHIRLSHPQKHVTKAPFTVKKFTKSLHSFSYSKPKKLKIQADGGPAVRKCLHCATQKTPQWRAGPRGPKTLCNACGVRYKSGRLCAEYRPAASPTFVESMHSNSHRKVLELRRKRGRRHGECARQAAPVSRHTQRPATSGPRVAGQGDENIEEI